VNAFIGQGGPLWVAIGFGILSGVYSIFWVSAEIRKSGAAWSRAITAGVVSAPFIGLGAFLIGLLIWPLLVIALMLMLIWPLRLLTKGGRDDVAYNLRLGRWRDRP